MNFTLRTRNALKILSVLFFIISFTYISGVSSISASSLNLTSTLDDVRQYMLDIAYLYAHHRWAAGETNILHPAYSFECGGNLCEQNHMTQKQIWSYPQNNWGTLPESAMTPNVDTPSWISLEAYNEGVPYAWGLSSGLIATAYDQQVDTGIESVFIPINATDHSFDELIAYKYFAGNINVDLDYGNSWAAGVDCIGLINNIWQMGARYPMDITMNQYAMPIKFKDLKAGDILMNYVSGQSNQDSHVMLFKEFIDFDPVNEEPSVGVQFRVYEASGYYGKVREGIYEIVSITDTTRKWPVAQDPPSYSTNEVTIKERIVDPGTGVLTYRSLPGEYIPRTYFDNVPMDVVFVIDKSNSMSGPQLNKTKEAVQTYIDLMRPYDRLAVIAFNDQQPAQQVYYPGASRLGLMDETQKQLAKQLVGQISASGGTSIGAGLQQGLLSFTNTEPNPYSPDPSQPPIRLMILISDGYGTGYDATVSQALRDADITIYTLGIGNSVREKLLKDIAMEHRGGYQWVRAPDRIQWALNSIQEKLSGINTVVQTTPREIVAAGATINKDILVDSAMGSMTISFFNSGSDVTLSIPQPDGTILDINAPNVTYVSSPGYQVYTILAPQIGVWPISVSSAVGGDYSLSISTMDAMTVSIGTDKDEYLAGEPIKITASVKDGIIASDYVHGASIQVVIENPLHAVSILELYDDGLHEDSGADDGIYANVFTDTVFGGNYNFDVHVSGNNNRDGLPFEREEIQSVVVVGASGPPYVTSIVRGAPNPTILDMVNYTVTFSEPVTGVDVSDFTVLTSIPGVAVTEVGGSNDIYTVTIDTGIGNGTIRMDLLDDDTILDLGLNKLGGTGPGNGDFVNGEVYDVSKILVTKLEDTNDGVCDIDCSLREAIDFAPAGRTILFAAGLSDETIHLANPLIITRDMTIDGTALADSVTISGDTDDDGIGDTQVIKINSDVRVSLKGLIIANGYSTASGGGGIYNAGILEIIDSVVSDNTANSHGGGIFNDRTLTITNSIISDNAVIAGLSSNGGGVYNNHFLTITNSTISDNHSAGSGGGVFSDGILTILNSTILNNSAYNGGGLWYTSSSQITNTTILNNTALVKGGGIYSSSLLATLNNDTISGNSAASGGGIFNHFGNLKFSNSIIANSSSGGDCVISSSNDIKTNINNLVEDGSCSASLSGDPKLGPLADNGGPTQTMALLTGSPAIDAGDPGVCSITPVNNLDQRGVSRPQGLVCDIGAYEAGVVITPPVFGNTFLGGNGNDLGYGVVRDDSGNIYVSGSSSEGWGSPLQPFSGTGPYTDDAFVAKLNPSGEFIWQTFLGGPSYLRYPYNIVLDEDGNIYVTGYADGTWGNPQRPYDINMDAYVAKLSPSGTLLWNTFLGGSGADQGNGIDVKNGSVYIAGDSDAGWGNPIAAYGAGNGFIANLDASTGTLNWHTFFGGGGDVVYTLKTDNNGNSYIAGYNGNAWGSPVRAFTSSEIDGFLTKFDSSGNLIWNTFLGGAGIDRIFKITLDDSGSVYLAGRSDEAWGDPVNGFSGGAQDGLISKIDASTGDLLWHSFVGGSGYDLIWDVDLGEDGYLKVAGTSDTTWGSPLTAYTGGFDAYVAKLNTSGGLLSNAFLGGPGTDRAFAVAAGEADEVYVIGYSETTWGDPLRVYTAGSDGFAAKVDLANAPLIVSSVTRNGVSPTNASTVSYTVNFSEAVTGVDASDFSLTTVGVTGASIAAVSGSGATYTVDVNTGNASGTIRLDVLDDDTIMDASFNLLAGGFTIGQIYSVDTSVPTVISSLRSATNPTASASVNFTVTFSEAVTGVNAGDFSLITTGVTGASIGAVTGSGTTYTVSVNTGSGSGTIRLDIVDDDSIKDAANKPLAGTGSGNGDFSSGELYTIDKTAPTVVSSLRSSASPTVSASVNFTVTFSETVTGVNAGDFTLTTTGVTGASIGTVTGSGTTYTVAVNTGSGSGTIRLNIVDDDSITDEASNQLDSGFTTGQTYSLDKTAPTVLSSLRSSASPTASASVNFTVTFSEAVTGVNAGDFSLTTTGVTGASIGTVTGSGTTYTVAVNTGSSSGTIRLNVVDDDSIMDTVNNPLGGVGLGNGNFSTGELYTIDKTAPTVSSSLRSSANPSASASVNFTVTFSEAVTGVSASDFILTTTGVTGTSIGTVTGSGTTYTVPVNTGSGSGTIRLDVKSTALIQDSLLNSFVGGYTAGQTYSMDKTAPTVSTITLNSTNPTNASTVIYTVTFSEVVTGVGVDDFNLTTTRLTGSTFTVSGSGSTYTVTVNTGSDNGTIRLNVIDNDTIKDAALTPLAGGLTSDQVYTIIKSATFTDVPLNYWANSDIERVYNAGIASGCSTTPLNYCPEGNVTRAQMAVFLLKGIHGSAYTPPPVGGSTGFEDVDTSYWAAAWIKQLVVEGITGGCTLTTPIKYCPEADATRDQMAVLLLKSKHGSGYTPPSVGGSTGFDDVPTGYWAAAWIKQLVAEGIASGCTLTAPINYCPGYPVTRAQMAVFLRRTFQLP